MFSRVSESEIQYLEFKVLPNFPFGKVGKMGAASIRSNTVYGFHARKKWTIVGSEILLFVLLPESRFRAVAEFNVLY